MRAAAWCAAAVANPPPRRAARSRSACRAAQPQPQPRAAPPPARAAPRRRRCRAPLRAARRDASPPPPPAPPDSNEAGVALGRAQLAAVAAMYGSMTVSLRYVYLLPGPPAASVLSAARGVLAALAFAPLLTSQRAALAAAPRAFWVAAAELTAYNCCFQGLLNVAVLDTDATRAAFLFQAAVIFTPALAAARGRPVAGSTWAGAALAAGGACLLALDGGGMGMAGGALRGGDAAALGAAAAYAIYIYRLSELGAAGAATDLTQALKCLLQAGAYAAWAAADVAVLQAASPADAPAPSFAAAAAQLWPGAASGAAWAALAYSALVPGALADVLQARGQAKVSAAEASVLLAAEPLWTALLGAACLGERMGHAGWAGAALLLASLGLTSQAGGGGGDDGGRGDKAA